MLHRTAFTIAFVVGIVARCGAQWRDPLLPILDTLDEAKLSGSMELSDGCSQTFLPSFPQPHALATSDGSAVQKLREILADDPPMRVTQDQDGTVRMVENGVPADILNLKIRHVTFEDYAHNPVYTPDAALRAILRAPEVASFMSEHNMGLASYVAAVPGNAGPWPPELTHLSGTFDNITLAQALDQVLKTFPGLWVYWNCAQSDHKTLIYFRFFAFKRLATGAS